MSVELRQAIEKKAPVERVSRLARALGGSLLEAYPVPLAPRNLPDLSRASTLFSQNCASCHGASGSSPPAASMTLEPPPIDFTDADRARQRSIFGLYQVITQGLEGTSMPSFAALPEADRWALAFYAGGIAFEDLERGEKIWREDDRVRRLIPDLETLAAITPAELADAIGENRALAVMAYLRSNPGVVSQRSENGSLDLARQTLQQSLAAYERGERAEARRLALSAYLDGFEPVEGILATRDGDLMRQIEQALSQYRSDIESAVPVSRLRERHAFAVNLLDQAEVALAPEAASDISTFLGAFTILLREGVEALLVVIAMIAFVRKSNRGEVIAYVHG
ncbi:MAG: c-type cytochrome, partial [Pseudomonadota bacterium]|nr:c-type cytochrome [Pseudomonadota bacterium]